MMKKSDIFLMCVGIILLIVLLGIRWILFVKILCALFLIGLVLYWKIVPFNDQLFIKYQQPFNFLEIVVRKLLGCLSFIPKLQLGRHLQLDSSFIIYILFFVLILTIF